MLAKPEIKTRNLFVDDYFVYFVISRPAKPLSLALQKESQPQTSKPLDPNTNCPAQARFQGSVLRVFSMRANAETG